MSDDPPPSPPINTNDAPVQRRGPKLWQTKAREAIVPYLPPPVIKAIGQIDAQLEPTVGPEASVTMGSTLLAMYVVVVLVQFLTS